MDYKYLNNINSPADLKALPREALPEVCTELRDFIVRELSHNPGHLGSSLGVIELTVALHYVFDTPDDRLVWDVGHQAYAHKILTGRRDAFHTNRQFGGLAPFPTPAESEYDTCVSGHASNSISAALGMQVASGRERKVVAIIGDGAMTGGLAFEGLNNASMDKNNLLIILNDNNMAIDPIKGGFTQYLVDLTTSPGYNKLRWWGYQLLVKMHLMSDHKRAKMLRFHNNLKTTLTKQPNNIFQGLNIRYFGPADGHDVIGLVRILSEIKNFQGPKVLHIVTQKGKGYAPAEADQTVWHAQDIYELLQGGIVVMRFYKKDGSVRDAVATRCGNFIPYEQLPKGDTTYEQNWKAVPYYDIAKRGWRSFSTDGWARVVAYFESESIVWYSLPEIKARVQGNERESNPLNDKMIFPLGAVK